MSEKSPFTGSRMDALLALVFSVLVCLPLVGGMMGWDLTHDLGEKRALAQCPVLGRDPLSTIPEKFETFYQDHFGFRKGLIRGHNWIRYKLCKGSSFGKVLFGKGDWLFLTKSGILPDFLGQDPMTAAELDAWRDALEQRQRWLGERGIRYLFVVAPNKATIYPEMLPDHIQRGRGRSRMDQLVDHLRDHSSVQFIDLRLALLRAKTAGLIYHPKDSHWTDRGAFIAYEQICKRLGEWFADIQPPSCDGFELTTGKEATDLSLMLGLGEELAGDTELWVPKTPRAAIRMQLIFPVQHASSQGIAPEDQVAMENAKGKYRLVMFHDSFAVRGGLREHLGECFSRSAFTSITPDAESLEWFVEQEHPDLIIEEMVERKLKNTPSHGLSDEE
jgi:alginate O-acetyltransferase complex protein AlgJ